jgi:hypothetical protein
VLDKFIEEGKNREALEKKVVQSRQQIERRRSRVDQVAARLRDYRNALIAYAEKLFKLKDNKIVIHPIKWTGTE